jgi:hypothetical protein
VSRDPHQGNAGFWQVTWRGIEAPVPAICTLGSDADVRRGDWVMDGARVDLLRACASVASSRRLLNCKWQMFFEQWQDYHHRRCVAINIIPIIVITIVAIVCVHGLRHFCALSRCRAAELCSECCNPRRILSSSSSSSSPLHDYRHQSCACPCSNSKPLLPILLVAVATTAFLKTCAVLYVNNNSSACRWLISPSCQS